MRCNASDTPALTDVLTVTAGSFVQQNNGIIIGKLETGEKEIEGATTIRRDQWPLPNITDTFGSMWGQLL